VKNTLWPPVIVLAFGALLATVGVRAQRTLELRGSLDTAIPATIGEFRGRDLKLTSEEISAVGVTNYLARVFENPDSTVAGPRWFQVYIGYYDRQASGRTIHSPKNCLPGGGWEPLRSETAVVTTPTGPVTVNRYLIQNPQHQQALVFYWYQGRGRVASNEYLVKWDLVRDAALRRRSEEALVRIVVPVSNNEEPALTLASIVASRLVPSLGSVLPG
jgi:EpsI family protein